MSEELAQKAKAHPELEKPLEELKKIAAEIDVRFSARVERIKTPDHVARMNDDFRKNVMAYEGPDALDRCKAYATALVEIGDSQDELVGECRWVIRTLRQHAGISMTLDPRMATIGAEIRAKTQEAFRKFAQVENATH